MVAVAFLSNRLLLQSPILGNGRFYIKAARDTNFRHMIQEIAIAERHVRCSRISRQEFSIAEPCALVFRISWQEYAFAERRAGLGAAGCGCRCEIIRDMHLGQSSRCSPIENNCHEFARNPVCRLANDNSCLKLPWNPACRSPIENNCREPRKIAGWRSSRIFDSCGCACLFAAFEPCSDAWTGRLGKFGLTDFSMRCLEIRSTAIEPQISQILAGKRRNSVREPQISPVPATGLHLRIRRGVLMLSAPVRAGDFRQLGLA